jgi:membrane dipeptidase
MSERLSRREFTRRASAMAAVPLMADLDALVEGPHAHGLTAVVARAAWDGYAEAMVIDCLASPGPFNVMDRMGQPLTAEMVENARGSGITAVSVTLNQGGAGHSAFDATVAGIGYFQSEVARHPDVFMQVRTVADLHRAKETGRLGLIYSFQDTAMLEGDVSRLDLFHDFGVKVIQLTYNLRNEVGDGCLETGNGGLSKFGRDVVARMNELGIAVDTSHCGQRTTAEAIETSTQPVAITHSACQAVYEHPRSKRDEELRAMADGGGVIGIYLMPFLNAEGPATAEHLIQHIEHAVNVCGEDHVGIGSDNSITPTEATAEYRAGLEAFAAERQRLGIGAPREYELLFVPELNTPRRMEQIADAMLARAHSATVVEKVIGGNWERYFRDVWGSP